MAGLWWMAVTLGLLLSAGSSVAVTQNQLAGIVNEMLNKYTPSYEDNGIRRSPMFSLAVSIPSNGKGYDISKVTDDPDQVRNTIIKCEVYASTRVVAATVLRWPNVLDQCPQERVQWPHVKQCGRTYKTWADVQRQCPRAFNDGRADHAEYRTLQRFDTLTRNLNKNDFLLFYVLSSPCGKRCTDESNQWNILTQIKQIMRWENYAVVFSNVFRPRSGYAIPERDLREALERLGQSVGLSNIFRCRKGATKCTSCFNGHDVTHFCYSDNPQRDLQHGKSYPPSRSGQGDRDKQNNNINTKAGLSTNVGSRGGKGRQRQGRGKNEMKEPKRKNERAGKHKRVSRRRVGGKRSTA